MADLITRLLVAAVYAVIAVCAWRGLRGLRFTDGVRAMLVWLLGISIVWSAWYLLLTVATHGLASWAAHVTRFLLIATFPPFILGFLAFARRWANEIRRLVE